MDSRLLRSYMAKEGKSGVDMAAALGVCYGTWVNKILGRKEFTVAEVIKIRKALSLSNEQVSEIFLHNA